MKQQPRWMTSVLAEAAREAANPTLLPWQRKKTAATPAPRGVAQPMRAAARA